MPYTALAAARLHHKAGKRSWRRAGPCHSTAPPPAKPALNDPARVPESAPDHSARRVPRIQMGRQAREVHVRRGQKGIKAAAMAATCVAACLSAEARRTLGWQDVLLRYKREAPTSHERRLSAFTAQDRSDAYIHCGVREHVMGAMANGLAAHGGADGPAGEVRLQPRFHRHRQERAHAPAGGDLGGTARHAEHARAAPADAVEAAECWELALAHQTGPTTLVFAR